MASVLPTRTVKVH